jgi:signal transduction histidine kinase/HAMP domain-containing protein
MRIKSAVRLTLFLITSLMVLYIAFTASFNRTTESGVEDLKTSTNVRNLFDSLQDTTNEYFLYRTERADQQWRLIHGELLQLLASQRFQAFQKKHRAENLRDRLQLMGKSFQKLTVATGTNGVSKNEALQEFQNRLITQITLNAREINAAFDDISRKIENELLWFQRLQSLMDIIALILVAIFVTGISLFLSKFVVQPVLKLHEGAENIGRGNLDYTVGMTSRDEIGELSRAFDRMTANLKRVTVSRDELIKEVEERQRAEEALKTAQSQAVSEKNRLEAVMDALPVGVAIVDALGGNVHSNRMFDLVWGGPRPLPQGVGDYAAYKAWWVDTGKPVRPEEWASSRAIRKKGTVLGQVMKIQKFDGKYGFVINSATPIMDAGGKVTECAVAILDISELQQAEEALRRHHAILTGINRIFKEALICETEEKLGKTCLAVAEGLTGSKFGFICEINEAGRFDTIAISNPGWVACKIPLDKAKKLLYDVPVCGIRSKVFETAEPLLCNDPPSHPDYVPPPEGHPPITAFLGVPLKYANQTIGLIALGNKEGGYADTDRETIETLAPAIIEALMRQRAELAVREARDELEQRVEVRTEELHQTVVQLQEEVTERQQAEQALHESEQRLRYLTSQILTAQEQERKRIAMDLHEGLAQNMTSLKLFLRAMQRHLPAKAGSIKEDFDTAHKLIIGVIEDVRRISRGLSPALLENLGLTAALNHLFEELSKYQKIKVNIVTDRIENLFSPETEINLFRIFQESFNNIAKHSRAKQVLVSIKRQDGRVDFVIKDNGSGFDLGQILQKNSGDQGMGLAAMHERLRMIGAHFNIISHPGIGTEISFSIPVDAK